MRDVVVSENTKRAFTSLETTRMVLVVAYDRFDRRMDEIGKEMMAKAPIIWTDPAIGRESLRNYAIRHGWAKAITMAINTPKTFGTVRPNQPQHPTVAESLNDYKNKLDHAYALMGQVLASNWASLEGGLAVLENELMQTT